MIKINNFRIDEDSIVAYLPFTNGPTSILPSVSIKIYFRSFENGTLMTEIVTFSNENDRNAMLDAIDSYFSIDEIEIDDDNFIN